MAVRPRPQSTCTMALRQGLTARTTSSGGAAPTASSSRESRRFSSIPLTSQRGAEALLDAVEPPLHGPGAEAQLRGYLRRGLAIVILAVYERTFAGRE